MNITEKKLTEAFTEWDLRYRLDPEKFMNDVEHLLGSTPYSYGKACSAYLVELLEELD